MRTADAQKISEASRIAKRFKSFKPFKELFEFAGTFPFRIAGTTGGWPVSFKMF
jgi:hypothetical protein